MFLSTICEALQFRTKTSKVINIVKGFEFILMFLAAFAFFNSVIPSLFNEQPSIKQKPVDKYFTQPHRLSILGDDVTAKDVKVVAVAPKKEKIDIPLDSKSANKAIKNIEKNLK
jgi:hypothetical protein